MNPKPIVRSVHHVPLGLLRHQFSLKKKKLTEENHNPQTVQEEDKKLPYLSLKIRASLVSQVLRRSASLHISNFTNKKFTKFTDKINLENVTNNVVEDTNKLRVERVVWRYKIMTFKNKSYSPIND